MDKQALIDLKGRIGKDYVHLKESVVNAAFQEHKQQDAVYRAYDGSVDAALSLLEAVLPGWDWEVAKLNGGLTVHAKVGPDALEFSDTPARALLLAILEALISQA